MCIEMTKAVYWKLELGGRFTVQLVVGRAQSKQSDGPIFDILLNKYFPSG